MSVVIPCHDEPGLLSVLRSLDACTMPQFPVEIITVINGSEEDAPDVHQRNRQTFLQAKNWNESRNNSMVDFHFILHDRLPARHAGVGLARKIGMDEAVIRFEKTGQEDGVIVCLDADCTVDKNYLTAIENLFLKNRAATGCSIYFEHPLDGDEFETDVYRSIINYELHLRYYCFALRYCRFPHPFHTIGSCMAVRNRIYQKQGGMNRRKAGEDFYFLHKIFPLGNFYELNTTCVYPSPRPSHRVPFGTGSSVKKNLMSGSALYPTYHPSTFSDLKKLFEQVPHLAESPDASKIFEELPQSLQQFIGEREFIRKTFELHRHSASPGKFVKRFFNWFDGFLTLKFVHFAREHFYPPLEITSALAQLNRLEKFLEFDEISEKKELLELLRNAERKRN